MFEVGFAEPKKPFLNDQTPLTKQERDHWLNDGEWVDEGATRADLIDDYSGRNFSVLDQRSMSEAWDDFLDKFGYDAVSDGHQTVLRKTPVKVRSK